MEKNISKNVLFDGWQKQPQSSKQGNPEIRCVEESCPLKLWTRWTRDMRHSALDLDLEDVSSLEYHKK